jgi:hypothetical protein
MRQIMIRCDDYIADLIKQLAYLESRSVNRQVIHMIQSHPLAEKAKTIPLSEIRSPVRNIPEARAETSEPTSSAAVHEKWKIPDEWFRGRD